MQATTRFHNGVANAVLEEAYLVFHDPIAFHTANSVFNTNADRRDTTIRRFLRGREFTPTGFFLRLDHGDPVEDKTLEAHILVEATAVWQGIAFQIRDTFIMHLAFIRGTQEAHVTGLIDYEQVVDRVARLLATIMVLLFLWICGAVDWSFSPIMPKRGEVGTSFRRHLSPVVALALALVAGLLFALPKTHGSAPAPSPAPDAQDFLAYILYLEPADVTTYTNPVYGFSFPYPQEYVLTTAVTDEGETVRAVSPRFPAGLEVEYLGPVVATNADEETFPLIIQRVHPILGPVADAWLSDGQDAYHVRMYGPDEAWVDGVIRGMVYYDLTLRSGATLGDFLLP